jgi:excisionase family DNA binding protein
MQEVFTVAEVAAMLKATPAALRERLRNGTLGGFRIGTDWRIPKADLDAFIERNRNSYRPEQPDEDDDADLLADAEATLDRLSRGEERTLTLDQWERRGDALDG